MLPALSTLLFGAGCGNGSEAPPPAPSEEPTIVLTTENNYTSTAEFDEIPPITTVAGASIDICFDAVTNDLQCHDVDAIADLDNIGIVRFSGTTPDEVLTQLAAGSLDPDDAVYYDHNLNHSDSCVSLEDFDQVGAPIDVETFFEENPDDTWLILATEGTSAAVGTRVMAFVQPTASSDVSTVNLEDGCGKLDFTATFQEPATVSASAPWIVSWRGVELDGQQNELEWNKIDRLLLGFYEGMDEAAIEAEIFDIETLPLPNLWEMELNGVREAKLTDARNVATGERFAGFDVEGDGTWLLALMCDTCQNPQPKVLTILTPGDG